MKERFTLLSVALIFIILATCIVGAGCFYYQRQQQEFRTEVDRNLAAIADMKVSEISMWRQDRLEDASIFYKNIAFSALLRGCIKRPQDSHLQEELQSWIKSFQANHHFDQISLLDATGKELMSVPETKQPHSTLTLQKAQETLSSGKILFEDFYPDEYTKKVYLRLFVPIFDWQAGEQPLGVLRFRIAPDVYLYPFIKRWPTPSKTAETLLIRREGNEAVFLNELNFQKNTLLTLRVPLEETDLLSVEANLSNRGVVEGLDYLGMPVLAAVRAVPDSPWFLVARIDAAEVYEPMRERFWLMVIFVSVSLLVATTVMGLIWRHQRFVLDLEKHNVERKCLFHAQRYEYLTQYANEIFLLFDQSGKIIDANDCALAAYGYTRDDMLALDRSDLCAPGCRATAYASMESNDKTKKATTESIHRRKDGTTFPVEINGWTVDMEGERFRQIIVRDITERKRTQAAMAEASQVMEDLYNHAPCAYHSLNGDGLIVRANDTEIAWLGYSREEYIDKMHFADIVAPDNLATFVNSFLAFKKNGWVNNLEFALVRKDGTTFPVLLNAIAIKDANGRFLRSRTTMFDISERKQSQEALQEAETRFRMLFDHSPEGIVIIDPEKMQPIEFNETAHKQLGYTREEFSRLSIADFEVDETSEDIRACITKVIREGRDDLETRHRTRQGEIRNVHVTAMCTEFSGHNIYHCVWRDITESKRMEEAVRKSEEQFKTIFNEAPWGIALVDSLTGHIYAVNPMFAKIAGRTMEEMPNIDWMSITHPDDIQEDLDNMAMLNAGKIKGFQIEKRYLHPDGTAVWINMTIAPIAVEDKTHPRHLCMIQDITDRKMAEMELLHAK